MRRAVWARPYPSPAMTRRKWIRTKQRQTTLPSTGLELAGSLRSGFRPLVPQIDAALALGQGICHSESSSARHITESDFDGKPGLRLNFAKPDRAHWPKKGNLRPFVQIALACRWNPRAGAITSSAPVTVWRPWAPDRRRSYPQGAPQRASGLAG